MNSKERNFLRKRAHSLEAKVRIGKEGITNSLLESIKQYLDKNELIKIKLLSNTLEDVTEELIVTIENYTKSIFITSIGKILIFFKEKRDKNKIGEITKEFLEFKKSRLK